MEAIVVFITAGSDAEAERISVALLDARQVACISVVADVDSRFWWHGNRDRARETLLIAKTRREVWPQVLETVRKHHSYEVFEAIALPILESNPDYLKWIIDTTESTELPASAGEHS